MLCDDFGLKQNVISCLTDTLFNCVFWKFFLLESFNLALQIVCLVNLSVIYANKMMQNVNVDVLKQKFQYELHSTVEVQCISDGEDLWISKGVGSAFS